MLKNSEDIFRVVRGDNIFHNQIPEMLHPYSEVIYKDVYGDEFRREGTLILQLKNSRKEISNHMIYSILAEYDIYCDDGADGEGTLWSEEIDSTDIESHILSILSHHGPDVDSNSFQERPDYTIKKLVDCVPHPDNANPAVLKYNASATAKLVLHELQRLEKRITQVRTAWKEVLESNAKEE